MSNKKGGLADRCLSIDQFGTEFKFRMPDGRTKRKTCIGVFMTLLLIAILITFIVYRLNDMRQGPVVIESMELDYFDIDNIFRSDEENFRFAFGLTDFDNGVEVDLEDQALYGTMKVK